MTSKHEHKYCPRCNSMFECKVGAVELCQCSKVNLDDKARSYLEKNYSDCLCAACMEEISVILKNNSTEDEYPKQNQLK